MPQPRLHPILPTIDDQKVERGLDPRSIFPRCDFCASKTFQAMTQIGRWWAHATCAIKPDNLTLVCVRLPVIDYRAVAHKSTNSSKVYAMLAIINAWAGTVRARLREAVNLRGDVLIEPDITQWED